eukprot:10415126-Alexandrium_andersonii.AAC.1
MHGGGGCRVAQRRGLRCRSGSSSSRRASCRSRPPLAIVCEVWGWRTSSICTRSARAPGCRR